MLSSTGHPASPELQADSLLLNHQRRPVETMCSLLKELVGEESVTVKSEMMKFYFYIYIYIYNLFYIKFLYILFFIF